MLQLVSLGPWNWLVVTPDQGAYLYIYIYIYTFIGRIAECAFRSEESNKALIQAWSAP